ncbi:class I lanthipeptide [uncultured Lacinutrix sp.]|uniref:class I lanthipeptide n=1 Tax=uncultured Lacinutrix sp. TaxID=574032 RepID=UPI002604DD12|nr:class I lanthipeptide [uncultured Lacinutrix sp.]
MKTQKAKLKFSKSSITELNQSQLNQIKGGTGTTIINQTGGSLSCSLCINSSNGAGGDIIAQMRKQ